MKPLHAFSEPVFSSLPYIEVVSREKYDYSAVLMDEERMLGLRVCSQHNIRKIAEQLVDLIAFSNSFPLPCSEMFVKLMFCTCGNNAWCMFGNLLLQYVTHCPEASVEYNSQ